MMEVTPVKVKMAYINEASNWSTLQLDQGS